MGALKDEILQILNEPNDDIKNLSVAEVEETLLKIREIEQLIAEKQNKRDQSIAYYQHFIDNAKENFDTDTKQYRDDIASLKHKLQCFYDANPPKGRKNLKFAAGSFGYNKAQTEFFFNGQKCDTNNHELLKFCSDNDKLQFVKFKEYLDWASLKKNLDFDDPNVVVFADTGEVINGLRAKKIFSVKTT